MTHRQKLINCILYIHDSMDLKINSNVHTDILVERKLFCVSILNYFDAQCYLGLHFGQCVMVSAGGLMLGAYRGS